MTILKPYFTSTPIYNRCSMMLPKIGTIGQMYIPMHLTKLDTITVNSQLTQIAYGPMIDQTSNTSAGGSATGLGVSQLPKLLMEGWIDTPTVLVGQNLVPNIFVDGNRVTYAEVIAMYMEGRAGAFSINNRTYWQRPDPMWFLDPMGRVYNNPRIWGFTATRIEAVPSRTEFTMTLLVR